MNNLKRIFSYMKKNTIITLIILTIISTLIGVITPYIIGKAIDNINKNIINLLIVLLIFYIMKLIISIITNNIVIIKSQNILYELRKEVFNKLEQLPLTYFDKNDKGNIMSILTNDIDKINDCLSEVIITIIASIITFIGVTIMMFYMNFILSSIVIITVPLFFIIISKMSKKINDYFMESQNTLGELTSETEEIVSNLKTIKTINKEKYFIRKFDKINEKYKKISINSNMYSYLLLPINIILNNLSNILIIGVGSILVVKGKIEIGSIIAFLSYASMFREPITEVASLSSTIGEAIAGSNRIFEIIDYKIEKNKNNKKLDFKKNIVFKNVKFKYDKKYILKNIDFEIKAKEKIAIIGQTGSGKTTIASLLLKFYKINSGKILIDNIDINDIDIKSLRENIGIVLQENYLFNGTIMENIKYGNKISDEKVIEICKKIGANRFIEKLENGYNTVIDYDASNISNGEKQLISIIRCIVKNPKIVILDEATSDVDLKTEKYIYQGLQELLKNKTSIIIAHRLSTIKNADKIIVIEKGKIIEIGNHNKLIKNKNKYYELYNKQFE
ncbi:MAG: ABC transporter ATP-binding protein [Bacilli bacterium]|nr:ABC transporter ATP-binding protein [Bacilli bacterium]